MKKVISILIFVFAGIIVSAQTPARNDSTIVLKGDSTVLAQEGPLTFAEVMPTFPGGQGAFSKYLCDSIKYPQEEHESGKQGTVYICFTVEKDGSISDIHAVKGVLGAPGLTKESIRVISEMPNWMPGTMNGDTVRVEITQPIRFVLQGDRDKSSKKKKH